MKDTSQLNIIINKANGAQSFTNIFLAQIPNYSLASKILVDHGQREFNNGKAESIAL